MSDRPLKQARRKLSPLKRLSESEMQMLDEAQLAERAERIRTAYLWSQQQKEKLREKERLKKDKEREEMEERRKMEEQRLMEVRRLLMEEGRRMMEERKKTEQLNLNLRKLLHDECPNWAETPIAALSIIFAKLGAAEFCASTQFVCRSWRYLPLTSPLPPCIDMRSLSTTRYHLSGVYLAKRSVDCTTGPIEQLHVKEASDPFLTEVVDRCYTLKSCSLIRCCKVSPTVLIDFLRRCPLLEELNIYWALFLHSTYGHIGQTCPQLKCFSIDVSYNDESNIDDSDSDYHSVKKSIKYGDYDDSDTSDPDSDDDPVFDSGSFLSTGDHLALEIANNMSQLRELRIRRNLTLTNKGLHFILDGCTHLEYLELKCCYYIRVDNVLHAKLDKIKTVKLSHRSVRVFSMLVGKQVFI